MSNQCPSWHEIIMQMAIVKRNSDKKMCVYHEDLASLGTS